jgi:hypothetical protein
LTRDDSDLEVLMGGVEREKAFFFFVISGLSSVSLSTSQKQNLPKHLDFRIFTMKVVKIGTKAVRIMFTIKSIS